MGQCWRRAGSGAPAHGRVGTGEVDGVLGVEGVMGGRAEDLLGAGQARGVVPGDALLAGRPA